MEFEEILNRLVDPDDKLVVVVDASGFHRVVYAPTGAHQERTMSAGKQVFTAQVPVVSPVTLASAPSLPELLELSPPEDEEGEDWVEYRREQEERHRLYAARDSHLEGVLSGWEADLRAEASRRLASRSGSLVLPCRSCEGAGAVVRDCGCTETARLVDLGVLGPDGFEGSTEVELEPSSPGCSACAGTGVRSFPCSSCGSAGTVSASVPMRFVDELTGEEVELLFDVDHFVASGGPLTLRSASYHNWGELVLSLDFRATLEALLSPLGLDLDSTRPVTGEAIMWEFLLPNLWHRVGFRVLDPAGKVWSEGSELPAAYQLVVDRSPVGDPLSAEEFASVLPDPGPVLDSLTAALASSLSWVPQRSISSEEPELVPERALADGYVLDAAGMLVRRTVHLRRLGSAEELVSGLRDLAADRGHRISLASGFIATGETGPTIYLLDSSGTPLAQLALEYEWRTALLSARSRLLELYSSPL